MESLNMEPESFQQLNYWLINNLEPISDADPVVLAKYVIALIQKDKPEKQLRQKCLKQLEIFLGNETGSFVDLLFDSIKNKSYMNAKIPPCLAKENDTECKETTTQASPTTTTDPIIGGGGNSENCSTTNIVPNSETTETAPESMTGTESISGVGSFFQQKKKASQNRIKISFKSFDDPAKSAMIANAVSSSTTTVSDVETRPSPMDMQIPPSVPAVQEVASSSSSTLPSRNDEQKLPKTKRSGSPRYQSSRHRHHRHRKYDDSSDDCSTYDEDDESDRETRGRRRRSDNDSASNDSSTESDKNRMRHQSTRRRSENESHPTSMKAEVRTTTSHGNRNHHHRNNNSRYHDSTVSSSHGRYGGRSRDYYQSSDGSRSNHRNNRYPMSSSRGRYNRDDYHNRMPHHYRGNDDRRSMDNQHAKYAVGDIDERIAPNESQAGSKSDPTTEHQPISVVNPSTGNNVAAGADSDDEEEEDADALHDQKCPELAEKGFCDKGLYCSYNSKKILKNAPGADMNFFMEPYNPETSIDPSMLMQYLMPLNQQPQQVPIPVPPLSVGDPSSISNFMMMLSTNNNNHQGKKRILDGTNNGTGSGGGGSGGRPRELLGVSLENGNQNGANNKKGRFRGQPVNSSGDRGYYNNNRYSNFQRNNNIDLLDRANNSGDVPPSSDHQSSNDNVGSNSRYHTQNNSTIVTTDHGGRHHDSDMKESGGESSSGKTYVDPALRQPNQNNNNNNSTWSSDKTTLVIRKIPHHLNTVGNLNKHFSKFGTVVYIQVCYQNDPEAAMIQFMNYFEATKAIRSTEAVFNNRFIKVYWAYPQDRANKGRGQQQQQKPHYHHGSGQQRKSQLPQAELTDNNAEDDYKPAPAPSTTNPNRFIRVPSNVPEGSNPPKKFRPEPTENVPTTPPVVIKSISSAERFKTIKALNEYTKLLNEKMINQKILMKKIEQAKTAKEKAAILKLGENNLKSIEELKQNILKAQEILKPTLRTTKVNNKHQAPVRISGPGTMIRNHGYSKTYNNYNNNSNTGISGENITTTKLPEQTTSSSETKLADITRQNEDEYESDDDVGGDGNAMMMMSE